MIRKYRRFHERTLYPRDVLKKIFKDSKVDIRIVFYDGVNRRHIADLYNTIADEYSLQSDRITFYEAKGQHCYTKLFIDDIDKIYPSGKKPYENLTVETNKNIIYSFVFEDIEQYKSALDILDKNGFLED